MAKNEPSKSVDPLLELGFHPATLYRRIRKRAFCLGLGVFPIDMAISEIDDEGFAGIRARDVLELLGPNNSLKSALAIAQIVATQKRFPDKTCIAVFSEGFDPDRLEKCGVDLERLRVYVVYDEETDDIDWGLAEKALNAVLQAVKNPDVILVTIDSVAALTPKGLIYDGSKEKEFGKSTVALLAKVMNEFIVKFKLHSQNASLTMVNHYKEKIQTDAYALDLEDKTKLQTPGGRGAEFLSDVRILCMTTIKMQEKEHSVIGTKQGNYFDCKWIIFKNKYCPTVTYRVVKGTFDPKTGQFNSTETLIDWGCFFTVEGKDEKGNKVLKSKLSTVISKAGSWVTVGDIKAQGSEKLAKILDETQPELVDKLKKEMYALEGQFFEDHRPTLEEFLEL